MLTRRAAVGGMLSLPFDRAIAQQAREGWSPVASQPTGPLRFNDGNGQSRQLTEFRGRPAIINIWATWCGPCVVELPALDRLQRAYGNKLTVLAVSVDRDGLDAVRYAFKHLKIRTLGVYLDPDTSLSTRLGIQGLPASWLVDTMGKIVASRRGAVDWDMAAERAAIERQLR